MTLPLGFIRVLADERQQFLGQRDGVVAEHHSHEPHRPNQAVPAAADARMYLPL